VTQAGVAIGLTRHAVNKVCIGENKTAGGFIWEYENKDHNHLEDVDLASAKSVVDYPNYYVFPTGCIFNKQRKSFMKPCINGSTLKKGFCVISYLLNPGYRVGICFHH
jgi:hypothetical protein